MKCFENGCRHEDGLSEGMHPLGQKMYSRKKEALMKH